MLPRHDDVTACSDTKQLVVEALTPEHQAVLILECQLLLVEHVRQVLHIAEQLLVGRIIYGVTDIAAARQQGHEGTGQLSQFTFYKHANG